MLNLAKVKVNRDLWSRTAWKRAMVSTILVYMLIRDFSHRCCAVLYNIIVFANEEDLRIIK